MRFTKTAQHAFAHGASLLFVSRRGGRDHVLLARRAPWVADPGTWGTAGGHLDAGDGGDPWRCAVREAVEEFGQPLAVVLRRPIDTAGTAGAVRVLAPRWPPHTVFAVRVGKPPVGWPQLNAESVEARWFALSDLPPETQPFVVWACRRLASGSGPSRAAVISAFAAAVRRVVRGQRAAP